MLGYGAYEYTKTYPEYPADPCFYFLGNFDGSHFHVVGDAAKPHTLDYGKALYAPNIMDDPEKVGAQWFSCKLCCTTSSLIRFVASSFKCW